MPFFLCSSGICGTLPRGFWSIFLLKKFPLTRNFFFSWAMRHLAERFLRGSSAEA